MPTRALRCVRATRAPTHKCRQVPRLQVSAQDASGRGALELCREGSDARALLAREVDAVEARAARMAAELLREESAAQAAATQSKKLSRRGGLKKRSASAASVVKAEAEAEEGAEPAGEAEVDAAAVPDDEDAAVAVAAAPAEPLSPDAAAGPWQTVETKAARRRRAPPPAAPLPTLQEVSECLPDLQPVGAALATAPRESSMSTFPDSAALQRSKGEPLHALAGPFAKELSIGLARERNRVGLCVVADVEEVARVRQLEARVAELEGKLAAAEGRGAADVEAAVAEAVAHFERRLPEAAAEAAAALSWRELERTGLAALYAAVQKGEVPAELPRRMAQCLQQRPAPPRPPPGPPPPAPPSVLPPPRSRPPQPPAHPPPPMPPQGPPPPHPPPQHRPARPPLPSPPSHAPPPLGFRASAKPFSPIDVPSPSEPRSPPQSSAASSAACTPRRCSASSSCASSGCSAPGPMPPSYPPPTPLPSSIALALPDTLPGCASLDDSAAAMHAMTAWLTSSGYGTA